MPLTEKQKRFCDAYIARGNATRAAVDAGYSQKTAGSIGSENLKKPELRAYIDDQLEKLESSRIANAQEVLQYWTAVMRGEHTDTIPVLCGDGAQELKEKPADEKDRIKASENLAKVLGMYASGGPAYGIGQRDDDPLTKSLKEEAARLDAQ